MKNPDHKSFTEVTRSWDKIVVGVISSGRGVDIAYGEDYVRLTLPSEAMAALNRQGLSARKDLHIHVDADAREQAVQKAISHGEVTFFYQDRNAGPVCAIVPPAHVLNTSAPRDAKAAKVNMGVAFVSTALPA